MVEISHTSSGRPVDFISDMLCKCLLCFFGVFYALRSSILIFFFSSDISREFRKPILKR